MKMNDRREPRAISFRRDSRIKILTRLGHLPSPVRFTSDDLDWSNELG